MAERATIIEKLSIFLAESLGTGLLVFLGCLGCITWGQPYNHLQTVLSFGLVILIVVQTFGCVSGAHINPVITVAATIFEMINVKVKFYVKCTLRSLTNKLHVCDELQTACIYFVAQFLGAFMGYGLLKVLVPVDIISGEGGAGLCVTLPNPRISIWQAFAVEFFATLALVWFCCGVWDQRNAHLQDCVSLKFGLAVAGLAAVTVRI